MAQLPSTVPERTAPTEPTTVTLAEGYYADNFQTVLDTVMRRYGDLLTAPEQRFSTDFQALPLGARRLYVRMISRKGPLLRRDRLRYSEIPNLDGMLAVLRARGFADTGEDAATADLVGLLLRAELGTLWRRVCGTTVPAKRDQRLAGILEHASGQQRDDPENGDGPLRRTVRDMVSVARPSCLDRVTTFQLLFFGSLQQDWTAFVLRDLGVVRHEPYPLDATPRRFRERQAIDHALLLWARREQVHKAISGDDLEAAQSLVAEIAHPSASWHPVVARLADRIVNRVARQLERAGRPRRALALFARSETPPARERRARLLAQLDRPHDAIALCDEIAGEPRDEQELAFANVFAERLERRLTRARPVGSRPPEASGKRSASRAIHTRPPTIPRHELIIERQANLTVEQQVLDALARTGATGFFAENWLWKSLFGLAFWDVLFAPVPGAFEHPFQLGPADLHEPTFRHARSGMVAQRLAWLRATPHVGPVLLRRFDRKLGTANSLVSWHPGARPALALALNRLRGGHLAAVFDRLSRDVRRYRRGFPDLFVIADRWPGFALHEVKAPGDQLRPEQRAWLRELNGMSMNASVLTVCWR